MVLTTEQILALAPDVASAKAGSQQANRSKWTELGAHEQALWGLCQGSGKDPYRAQIELAEPAFKCSCPSRKFPCKHTLGLYLLYAQDASVFVANTAPQWVNDWLQGRGQRAEKKAAKSEQSDTLLSPEEVAAKLLGQQKRQDKRAANVEQGLDVLDIWLDDLAREGLAGLKTKPAKAWDAMAARMVDAQAGGLATRIRRAGMMIYGSSLANWELEVARELGLLALLSQSYRRIDSLPDTLQCDIRTAIGWVATQEDAVNQPAVYDIWQVIGCHTQHDERVSRRACYLRGLCNGRWAMILQFSAGAQALPPPLLPGILWQGSMHFYPGALPMRAVFAADMKVIATLPADCSIATAPTDIADQLTFYAQALAVNPFIDQHPMLLQAVVPQYQSLRKPAWMLRSAQGTVLPLASDFKHGWRLLAITGGAPVQIFGMWDGSAFLPLSVTVNDRWYNFDIEHAL